MNAIRRLGRHFAVVAAASVVLATAAACGGSGGGGSTVKEVDGIKLVEAGKLTVCTHLPYPPFQDRDKNDKNKIIGFDVDLLDLLAKDMGIEQKVVNLGEWSQVTSGAAFKAGKCDVGMGAMTITDERKKALTISDPYFDATQVLVARKVKPYKSLQELVGKKVGVQADTTGQTFVQDQTKVIQGLNAPIKYDDAILQLNNVKSGNVDAGVNDNGLVLAYVKDNPDVIITADLETKEQYGFPAGQDEKGKKIIDRLNKVLTEAKKSGGDYEKVYEKWFGVKPGEKIGQ